MSYTTTPEKEVVLRGRIWRKQAGVAKGLAGQGDGGSICHPVMEYRLDSGTVGRVTWTRNTEAYRGVRIEVGGGQRRKKFLRKLIVK